MEEVNEPVPIYTPSDFALEDQFGRQALIKIKAKEAWNITTGNQKNMKGKVVLFISTFVGYCLIFLMVKDWNVTNRQIAEMIFIGVGVGFFVALMMNPTRRLIGNILRK